MPPARKRQRVSPSGDAVVTKPSDDIAPALDAADPDREAPSKKASLPSTLFVRSLPLDATTESLTEHFSQSYLLKHATVVLDPVSKKSKGYGFVTFADAEDADKARQEFDGSLLGKRRLRVEVAQSRRRVVDPAGVSGGRKSRPAEEALDAKAERRRKRAEQQSSTKLIVRNLPWSVDDKDKLALLFRSYGKVKKAILPPAKPGLSPGFGFVLLNTRENAEKALAAVNGKTIDGRTVAVDWAVDKETWERHKQGAEDIYAAEEAPAATSAGDVDPEDEMDVQDEESDLNEGSEDENMESDAASQELGVEEPSSEAAPQDETGTIFVRNLPFSAADDVLFDHFSQFGAIRYARVVMDHETERSRGTGFVCFYKKQDAIACLRGAPSRVVDAPQEKDSKFPFKHSLLENTMADSSGQYTLEGRVLHVTRAVERGEANRLAAEGVKHRDKRDSDKRRLFLLAEGTVTPSSPLYNTLNASERKLRDDSAKQRQTLVRGNPSLHLSLTRLSVRNLPRYVTSKQLKAIAREAVVGFAKDVKAGDRQPLTKEELARDGEAGKEAEKERKAKGKGIVRQAKIVFEDKVGSKVTENSAAGRSRGYGFIEYNTHRLALMGLRWLNGHLVERNTDSVQDQPQAGADKPKRLVVEFAIENVQVVTRRRERQDRVRNGTQTSENANGKRMREDEKASVAQSPKGKPSSKDKAAADRASLQNRIIGRKRAKQRGRPSA